MIHKTEPQLTVNIEDNISVVGDKFSKFLRKFLKHIRQINVFDHCNLPTFYAQCQEQIGNSCSYHTMMNMYTLYWGIYPIKGKRCWYNISITKNLS